MKGNKVIKHEFALDSSKVCWTEIKGICIISKKDLMKLLKEIEKLENWLDEYKKY